MARERIIVPFGYEPIDDGMKGTLFVMDDFDTTTYADIHHIFELAEKRLFEKVIFYPLHEQTLKRMVGDGFRPYFKRVEYLDALLSEVQTDIYFNVDKFEGKRRKYTPIETSMKHLMESYKKPYFLYVTGEYANKVSSYDSFEKLIKDVKLLIPSDGDFHPNTRLKKFENRWEIV